MNDSGTEKNSGLWLRQFVAKAWGLRRHVNAERVQASSTLLIALVTVLTLLVAPIRERFIDEVIRSVEETQEDLERQRMINAKSVLQDVWLKFDDKLADNEYFARIAGDYHTHVYSVNGTGPALWLVCSGPV